MKRYDHTASSTKRGYGATWRRLRRVHLTRSPLCIKCEEAGRIVPATVVDHRKSFRRPDGSIDDALRLDPDNLDSLCKPCHDRKTARTEGPHAAKVAGKGSDLDGTPNDPNHAWRA